jgi:hypothetical protein
LQLGTAAQFQSTSLSGYAANIIKIFQTLIPASNRAVVLSCC